MLMDAKLIAVEGEWRDHVFPLDGSDFLIGRAANCQLQIDHSLVDLEHCRIRLDGDTWALDDLGSTFGTSVNGKRVTNHVLQDGDRVRIGPTTLVVSLSGLMPDAIVRSAAEEAAKRPSRGRAPDEDTPAMESARQIFDRITHKHVEPEAASEEPEAAKTKLQLVNEQQGVSIVNIVDRAIIHDSEIAQMGQELDDLLDQGRRRIVLDFGNVKHLSSQAVGVLIQAQRRAKSGGGLLKLCNPNPAVAEVFKITNLPRAIEIHTDHANALRTAWPEAAPTASPPPPPSSAPAPAAVTRPAPTAPRPAPAAPRPAPAARPAPGPVRLVIEVGKSKGKAIKITSPSFLIGRDPQCQLRPASSAVSRLHTRIETREGRVYIKDLGTTNGTLLAHRLLRNSEVEAYNGDLLQIGPLVFRVVFQQPHEPEPPSGLAEDSSWLIEPTTQDLSDTALYALPIGDSLEEARQRALAEVQHVRYRVSGNVLIVTILARELREEHQVGPVRHELMTLMEKAVPKQVVLNLDHVTYFSSSAIGMLLAHYQRLARAGGGLRFCQVRPEARPALDNQRVAMLVETFPTLEAAVTEPWPIA